MENIRNRMLEKAFQHKPVKLKTDFLKPTELFNSNVFTKDKIREYLSYEAYEKVIKVIEEGFKMDSKTAGEVASAMKLWAISKGATHYTHWFQPLHGATAEKRNSFITPYDEIRIIEKFEGKELIQQEPDASSFPSGGIRNTYEARGYTIWDPASPAFILGYTLCIPTIFISYTGEALDYKTPLLKASALIDKAAKLICSYFNKNIKKVSVTLGWEQEYFLVDEALYNIRPDLIMAERTLFGHLSAKSQQLEDHYFASIPERVETFMRDFEIEAWKVGIPVNTLHNEVAPNQYEVAPVFEEVNIANDHNVLLIDIMDRIARKHRFRLLLHEKPFAGINGSGKHNNWSLMTDTGKNLLSPGTTPKNNLQFLIFLTCIIKAVYDYSDLLRTSIATAGNEHRLGANEAPPAIISIFIGSHLTNIINEIESMGKEGEMNYKSKEELKLEISKLPEIIFDNTDRNRTSPFAFTGNKFEFRALGSSANCASAMFILNTIVAEQLFEFKKDSEELINNGIEMEEAFFQVLRKYIIDSKKILFEGNNYSKEWLKEADSRGLSNIKDVPQALKAMVSDKNINILTKYNILSEKEIWARYYIELENYYKKIQIESRILGDLAINHIIPAAVKYQNELIANIKGFKEIYNERELTELTQTQKQILNEISVHLKTINEKVKKMIDERKSGNKIEDIPKKAIHYSKKVKPFLEEIRYHIDKLEMIIDDEKWPLPKYRELLFVK